MPSNRNKNRNRNKNKQRNKQQQQQQKEKAENSEKDSKEPSSAKAPINSTGHKAHSPPPPTIGITQDTNACALFLESDVADVEISTTNKPNELDVCKNVPSLKKVSNVTTTATTGTETDTKTAAVTETNDTVLNEPPQCDNKSKNIHGANTNDNMGNEKSKIIDDQRDISMPQSVEENSTATTATVPLGKVIVHRIVCEDSNGVKTNKEENTVKMFTNRTSPVTEEKESVKCEEFIDTDAQKPEDDKSFKVIIHKILAETDTIKEEDEKVRNFKDEENETQKNYIIIVNQTDPSTDLYQPIQQQVKEEENQNYHENIQDAKHHEVKVIIHETAIAGKDTKKPDHHTSEQHFQEHEVKVIEHQVIKSDDDNKMQPIYYKAPQEHQAKVIVHQVHLEDKEDRDPKITSPTMREPIAAAVKPTTSDVRIVEVSDESLSDLEELRSPVISEAESSIEYSDNMQNLSDSITEVSYSSSSSASSTASKQTESRKQKRIALEHHFLPQMLNPRFLDSISEENSELSDNSENPLSRSVSIESATNSPTEAKVQKLNAKYPKSSLDFSKPHKQQSTHNKKSKVIREEQVAVAVAARLQDTPDADESCSTVRSCMSPESEDAEVVFINSASSSISDLHDMELVDNLHAYTTEINLNNDISDILNNPMTENICCESVMQSASPAFTTNNQSNDNKNNQTINNSKLINNNTHQTPHMPPLATASAKTNSLAETKTNSNANSKSTTSTLSESPANENLVFAQIEEQISSVLSSINEVASQDTSTTSILKTRSSPSPSSAIHANLSNTQILPATTTSTTAAIRTPENSCEESVNTKSSSLCAGNNAKTSRVFSENVNMNTVRDILINSSNKNANDHSVKLNGNNETSNAIGSVKLNYKSNVNTPMTPTRYCPSPPPIPPPPQEKQKTDDQWDNTLEFANPSSSSALPLLQKHVDYHNSYTQLQHDNLKDLDCTLSLLPSSVTRQESIDSHCSDSTNLSQCTAINVAPDQGSDSVKTSSFSDLKSNTQHCHSSANSAADPKKLRLLCAETLASYPYGEAVLEELANIAQNIGEARAVIALKSERNMPYPLPELPHIDDLQLSLKVEKTATERSKASQQDQSWLGVATTNDPKVLVCLSPSQRSYIQQKPEQKPDDLLDAHQKFIERRGYHEYTKEQLQTLQKEKMAEQKLLQTTAMMKKLRKSITPPPPQIPPPPVPVKSSETATKAQNLSKINKITYTHKLNANDDVNLTNNNEQIESASNVESNGEENKHRLLSIIQNTDESSTNKEIHSKSSIYENSSRQTTNGGGNSPNENQVQAAASSLINGTPNSSYQFAYKAPENMQSVEITLGEMFPTIGTSNIFDRENKRFSNIESIRTEPFCSQIMNTQPKRYSSVETHSYETEKRIENGKVVQDSSNVQHETKISGDKIDDINNFPIKTSLIQENNSFLHSGMEQEFYNNLKAKQHRNDHEIMSGLNLNKNSSHEERKQQTTKQSETIIKTTTTKTSENITNDEHNSANTVEDDRTTDLKPESTVLQKETQNTYKEFRQHAKADGADNASTLPLINSAAMAERAVKVASNGDNSGETILSPTKAAQHKRTTLSLDHEKLFKEFDDLSKQLHRELEMSKVEREQREKSVSMYDLPTIHMRQKQQIEEFNKTRKEHLKELEQEIERSMKSRSSRLIRPHESTTDTVDHQSGRTYQIPINIENGSQTKPEATRFPKQSNMYDEAPPVPEPPKTYQIPIKLENSNNAEVDDSHFRRAESMFNLSNDTHHRQHTHNKQIQYQRTEDDWSKYASDLGYSENIARPFAKEVEICYQRRPGGIRAPRLSASTNDLSLNNQHSYDQYNAYNVRRHHAPMLNRAPEHSRPQFGSCYSMIERDPNPTYVSTTTRRGVSPAPQPSGYFVLDSCHVREEDMSQRRASLPREIHEQQLKYIVSKEEELRTEFERLQNERRRLMEEAQAPISPITPTSPIARPLRDHYRSTPKLPTLTEDEVFRQQMAEEWLNKVAEREKRRLQNIIKISKIHEDDVSSKLKANMEEEFLSRVKERRHKLAMPADSDWESGAESQPTTQTHISEAEDVPPVKIIEGEEEANLRRLPRHLREFAKFSNHHKEAIKDGHREEHQEEERSEEATDSCVSKAYKKSSVVKTVKTLHAPMLLNNGGHGRNQYSKTNGYQSEPEPNYDSDYSTIKYRTVNPNRLQSVSSTLNVRKSNDSIYGNSPVPIKSAQNSYRNQPGRIEDYVTGHSSVSDKEKKEHLDQEKLSSHYTEGNLSRALAKESGYTSDSNLVFRKKGIPQGSPLSPVEQKLAYKNVQAGGEPPLFGFRKPAPEKSKVSPNRYYESDVNIHFKTPVRQEFKYPLSEEEIAIRQAEHMQKLYQEERRRKYLQELQDMNSRRHTDNFTPSQKSPIPLNRYDDFPADLAPTPANQVKSVARALYNFQAQNSKELSFKKGDIIYIKRAIDKNWYEGEHNAMIGLFPANYVEIINKETVYPAQSQPNVYRKPSEGQARAKYNFQAQSGVELSLNKGELVALTRRVDDNWFEGRIANRKGIFPVSYVEVLTDIGAEDIAARTTTIQQTSVVNVRPSLDVMRTNINNEFNALTSNGNQPPNGILRETRNIHKTDILHVDTSSEPLVYRALYKYRPQNSDELELLEGDIVQVLEKCDDGWYVGTSQRTGCFGTFPGNYVERV